MNRTEDWGYNTVTLTHQTRAPYYSLTDTKCQTTAEHALAAGLALFVSSATVAPVLG